MINKENRRMKQNNLPSTVYIISNNREILKGEVIRRAGGFTTIRFDNGGGVRLRDSRIFYSYEQAKKVMEHPMSR